MLTNRRYGVMLLCGLALSMVGVVSEAPARDAAVRRAYLRALGLTRTPPGCQVDHILPLHCGGADVVDNLQLLCGPALRAKERAERDCQFFAQWRATCLAFPEAPDAHP